MVFKVDWKNGETVHNRDIIDKFKCAAIGGMRRSLKTNTLVLVSDHTNNKFTNAEKLDGIWMFEGYGVYPNDIMYKQNKNMVNSFKENIQLHLFIKKTNNDYTYIGEVINFGIKETNKEKIFFELIEVNNSKDISKFLKELGQKELIRNNLLQKGNKLLNHIGIKYLLNSMIENNIDNLISKGNWVLNRNGYYINTNDTTLNKKSLPFFYSKNVLKEEQNKRVFKGQNKFINPFFTNSIVENTILNERDSYVNEKNQKLLIKSLQIKSEIIDTKVTFLDENEIEFDQKYTSLLIGKNGVGKSMILSTLQKIFLDLKELDFKNLNLSKEKYIIEYKMGDDLYIVEKKEGTNFDFRRNNFKIGYNDLLLPDYIITSAFSYNDRFIPSSTSKNVKDLDYNGYIGFKNNQYSDLNRILARSLLFGSLKDKKFLINLSKVTSFLKFDKKIKITINLMTKENNSENISGIKESDLKNKKYIKSDYNKFYSHIIESKENIGGSSSKKFQDQIFFFDENQRKLEIILDFDQNEDYEKLYDELDLIITQINQMLYSSIEIEMSKGDKWLSLEQQSSGEFQFVFTIINILSKIQNNSLILIDEPETSLHPNWQFKYLSLLNEIFNDYKNIHFIIATHSHFIVSDLNKINSNLSVIRKKTTGEIVSDTIESKTYGRSAEDILYDVFNLPTTRNYYVERDIDFVLEALSKGIIDSDLKIRVLKLKRALSHLNPEDPLYLIISKIEKKISGVSL